MQTSRSYLKIRSAFVPELLVHGLVAGVDLDAARTKWKQQTARHVRSCHAQYPGPLPYPKMLDAKKTIPRVREDAQN